MVSLFGLLPVILFLFNVALAPLLTQMEYDPVNDESERVELPDLKNIAPP